MDESQQLFNEFFERLLSLTWELVPEGSSDIRKEAFQAACIRFTSDVVCGNPCDNHRLQHS